MRDIEQLLETLYAGQERMSSDEIYRRAVVAELAPRHLTALNSLPAGEYAMEEVLETLDELGGGDVEEVGVPAGQLSDADLDRELAQLHRTRHDTFLHASSNALDAHSARTSELESEYLRRHPERAVERQRLRAGARQRGLSR